VRLVSHVLSFVFLVSSVAFAQAPPYRSQTSGLFVGTSGDLNNISASTSVVEGHLETVENGGGASFLVGYGTSRWWSMFSQISAASMASVFGGRYQLTHFDIGARVYYRSGFSALVPFVQGAGTLRLVSDGSGRSGSLSAAVGGGVNVYFRHDVAVATSALWAIGTFDSFSAPGHGGGYGDVRSISTRVQIGLVWYPGADR
jgi:hypothetical protein